MNQNNDFDQPVPIAISSCLLGHEVRFDGGHKKDSFITGVLSPYFTFIPICPEAGAGLGIPRDTIRLVKKDDAIRAVGVKKPDWDVTEKIQLFAEKTLPSIEEVCGYIVKKNSPSCGMERVKLYKPTGESLPQKARGLHIDVVMKANPLLPVEEEGRLNDPVLRENFIERIIVFRRLQAFKQQKITAQGWVEFHTQLKLTIMAHSQTTYQELGQLVANAGKLNIEEQFSKYEVKLMSALKQPVSKKQHANVLQHLHGYLKKPLASQDKEELSQAIDQYRLGKLPLIVPITLLKHHFMHHPIQWVEKQLYLSPYPIELMLRNQI